MLLLGYMPIDWGFSRCDPITTCRLRPAIAFPQIDFEFKLQGLCVSRSNKRRTNRECLGFMPLDQSGSRNADMAVSVTSEICIIGGSLGATIQNIM